jgi:hypothetical protein
VAVKVQRHQRGIAATTEKSVRHPQSWGFTGGVGSASQPCIACVFFSFSCMLPLSLILELASNEICLHYGLSSYCRDNGLGNKQGPSLSGSQRLCQ